MLKSFKDALDAGHIEPALLPDGTAFVEEGVTFYQSSNQGINMLMGRFHAFSDTLRRHDSLKLNDELLTTALETIETLARRIRAQANADSEQVLDANEEILLVVKRIKQRRDLGLEISQVYDIASLWFFAEDEHPGMPEPVKTRRNQQLWLNSVRSPELYAFFFEYAVKPIRTLTVALRSKYAELYEGEQRNGYAGLGANLNEIENDWGKSRDDQHYRIAEGDPSRLQYLTESTVERYYDYCSAWLRAESKKAETATKRMPVAVEADDE